MNRPIVETESGSVRGTIDGGVAAFRGIPYAASPVGDLRFAAPQQHPMWSGFRDAASPGPSVPQGRSRLEAIMGPRTPDWNEDGSLTVNVWTPRVPVAGSARAARPVLVWFHGGGFTSGSGGWDWYDGRALAAAGEIVVVTANYRIGPLGFLYLPDVGVENLGFLDQCAVLDWVKRNIGEFGGDPDDLTVGGQSAGAFSSLYLAASPVTGPLIRRIITQSGPFGLAPQSSAEAAAHAGRFVEILGVSGAKDMLAGLRAVPVDRLLSAYGQLAAELSAPGKVASPMYPVLGASGIPVTWQEALANGRLDGKDLLTGTTRNEMAAFLAFDPQIQAITAEHARELLARQVDGGAALYDRAASRRQEVAPSDVLTEVETEIVFRDGTLAIADHQAAAGFPTYVYQFDYVPSDDPAHIGAAHCSELPFFFDTIDAYPDSPMLGKPTAEVRDLADTFSRAVAAFVATGLPADSRWQPYESGNAATVRHFA
ncbi:carboxylesterase/lipase family protein [Mycobacterium sp. NPDC048908]|uniref:carboxylesterase/lipase family protein n=1 Tax=Mycobacterium sp. NPDC048908 TaxID=3364292 RepID=UPI0037182AE1